MSGPPPSRKKLSFDDYTDHIIDYLKDTPNHNIVDYIKYIKNKIEIMKETGRMNWFAPERNICEEYKLDIFNYVVSHRNEYSDDVTKTLQDFFHNNT